MRLNPRINDRKCHKLCMEYREFDFNYSLTDIAYIDSFHGSHCKHGVFSWHACNDLPQACFCYSAVLYLNDDFDGGELFFTDMDAKTVTVSCFLPQTVVFSRHREEYLPLGSVKSPRNPLPSPLMSAGPGKAQLWPSGWLLLRSSEPSWSQCSDRRPEVCSGPLVHQGEAAQGHGEGCYDIQE